MGSNSCTQSNNGYSRYNPSSRKNSTERVLEPHIPASRLRGLGNAYKIKLRASGYRLTYQVDDAEMAIYVLSVGKRERGIVYRKASERGS